MPSPLLRLRWLLLTSALAACSESADPTPPSPPASPPLQDGTGLAILADDDPAPDAIAVTLEARESEITYGSSPPTKVWTYNGTIPAPLIDAKVGDKITVHFTNKLPEPTTIHWHGVRLPAAMDGTLAMQQPIEPGQSFTYEFTFKDAGLFWFHPHMRSDIQVQKGLYGAIRVRGPSEPEVDDERVLVLDDVRLKSDGSLAEYLDDKALMMGREGNTLLVNGQVTPTLKFRPGALVRLRVVNTANGRFFNLKLPTANWRVIGTDGGMIPGPYDTERVLMSPGERYDLLVRMPTEPGTFDLTSEPYERGHDSGEDPPVKVATFSVEDTAVSRVLPLPSAAPAPERLADGPTDFSLTLDEKSTPEGTVFTINGAVSPDVPMIMAPNGSNRIFEVKNDSPMDHPFHLHGFFFQILARNGQPEPAEALLNKDTIIIPMHSSLKLVTRFDEPGMWMYHCHILEHAEHGMMGEIHVELLMKSRLFIAIVAVGASLVGCGSEASSADPTVQGAPTSGAAGAAQAEFAGAAGTGGPEGGLAGGGGLSGDSGQAGAGPGGMAGAGGQDAGGQGGETTAAGAGGQDTGGAAGGEAGAGEAQNVAGEGGQAGAEEAGAAGASEEGGAGQGGSEGWHPTK